MKFATSFNVFLALSLAFLVAGNIVGLVYFAPRYFSDYVEDVRQTFPNDEYTLINTFIASKDFDPATIEEYRLTLEDLKNLSKSLESYIPKKEEGNSTFESLQRIGFAPDTIREVLFLNSVQSFLSNITSIAFSDQETPEKRFLLRLLSTVVYMNWTYIALILLVTFLWTQMTFGSIRALTNRIHSLIINRDYSPLEYRRNDEFAPLVEAMNVLSVNLSRQEKIRSDFISDFSHEIKTPIAALKILFEGVEDGIMPLDAKNLKVVQNEIERLLSTTNAILEYEKVAWSESASLVRERFDLQRTAQEVLMEYLPQLSLEKQSATVDRQTPFEVFLEKEWVLRIFHNAFSNFAKYAGKSAKLTVKMFRRDGRVTLLFSDTGAWIPKEQIPYVHEKFYQADAARSGDVKRGIGIGLSTVDKIARLHDGYLSVTSDKGKGFQLKVVLSETPSRIIHSQGLQDTGMSV